MNPITAWKLLRKVTKVERLWQDATASYERTHDVSKSLFASKTFYFNLFTAAGEIAQMLAGIHVVPAGTLAIAASVINVGLRLTTDQPVHVVSPAK